MLLHLQFAAIVLFSSAVLGGPVLSPRQNAVVVGALTLSQQLLLSPTRLQRAELLQASDYVFDFQNATGATTTGLGGHSVRADSGTFPALIGTGVSVTIGFLGPCGFNTPHTHPRAAEFNIVVAGRLMSVSQVENKAPLYNHTTNTFQSAIFPQGALHGEYNPDCEPAIFVAAFGDEDPGVLQSAQSVLGLNDDILEAIIGEQGNGVTIDGVGIEALRKQIPDNIALGVDSCLRKCKLGKYA